MKIFFIDGRRKGDSFELTPPGASIGRELDNDIILEGEGESRYHAKIELDGTEWKIKDLESTNGTKLNDEKLTPNEYKTLKEGDLIKIGNQTMLFAEKLPEKIAKQSESDAAKEPEQKKTPSVIAIKAPSPMDETIPETKSIPTKEEEENSAKSFSDFFDDTPQTSTEIPEMTDFFGKSQKENRDDEDKQKHTGILFYVGVFAVTIILIAGFLIFNKEPQHPANLVIKTEHKHRGTPLLVRYEKQVITKKPQLNIFRYLMEIKNGHVTVTKDDLQSHYKKKLSRTVNEEELRKLQERIDNTDFMLAKQPQRGIASDSEDKIQTITVAYGEEMNSISVKNTPPPRSFIQTITALEEFSTDVLHIPPISLTPEEMKQAGISAYIKGKQLFDNYQAKNSNLFNSIKYFNLALESLDGFQSLPEFHDAYKYKQEAEHLLKVAVNKHSFNYERFRQLGDLQSARDECRIIMEMNDPDSKAYNKARDIIIKLDELIKEKRK